MIFFLLKKIPEAEMIPVAEFELPAVVDCTKYARLIMQGRPGKFCAGHHRNQLVTISEKSAIPENPFRTPSISPK